MPIIIGGFSKFGSSIYLNQFSKANKLKCIDYNSTRFAVFIHIIKNIKNIMAKRVYFQPAICFPGFLRDILIVAFLRILFAKITFIILSELHYKNKLLSNKYFRKIFFCRSHIISSAALIGPNYFQKSEIISPSVTPLSLPIAKLEKSGAILHLGYLSPIKGFEDFLSITDNLENKKIAIGARLDDRSIQGSNVYVTNSFDEFKEQLRAVLTAEKILCFLYCSKYDLSPLLLLELRNAKIPLVVLSGTRAELILRNYLKEECFVVVNQIAELNSLEIGILATAADYFCSSVDPFAKISKRL